MAGFKKMKPYGPIGTADVLEKQSSRWDYKTLPHLPADKSAGYYQAVPFGTSDQKKQVTFQTESVFFSK